MSVPTSIILDQWRTWECAGYSILWALIHMKPDIDYKKIEKELLEEDWNSFTLKIAEKWFVKKWYIKWLRKCTYSPLLLKKQPIITWVTNLDWWRTWKPPYMLTFEKRATLWTHYLILIAHGKWQNSAWESWGDKGCFYFTQNQLRNMKQMFAIIL